MPLIPVTKTFNVAQSNDPSNPVVTYMDFARVGLSDYYGKTIRQGATFTLKKIDVSLIPVGSGFDTGLSISGKFTHLPTTKHTRKAWNNIFTDWKRQKNLQAGVGMQVRYDDLEYAWDSAHVAVTSNISDIYGLGLASVHGTSGVASKMTLTGASVAGSIYSLEDYYESAFPILPPSDDPYGSEIKAPKFSTYWPPEINLPFMANLSSIVDNEGLDTLSGASASQTCWEGDTDVFCGVGEIRIWIIPDDTVAQSEDTATITITFWIESWKPLVYPSKKTFKRKSSYRPKRRYSSRRRGYSRRRRRRRY